MARAKLATSKQPTPRPASGRDRLIDAVVHLSASARGIASLGLRQIARQAGLNPNTFYRHFKDFDDLGLAVIERLAAQLRDGLSARWQALAPKTPRSFKLAVRESVELVFDFALEHRAAFVVAIVERHGSSPMLRAAIRRMMSDLADGITDYAMRGSTIPELGRPVVREIVEQIVRQMGLIALEVVEEPERRADLQRQAEHFIMWIATGAIASKARHALAAPAGRPRRSARAS